MPGDVGRAPALRPSRHGWQTQILKGLIIFVSVCLVLTGSGYLYLRHQLGRIKHVTIPSLSGDQPGKVMNVLLVGSDSRANVTGDLADSTGKIAEGDRPGLSDTMMVLHIDPRQGQAAILSIPRDLWLDVNGAKDRINSAFAEGGPQLLIKTIQDDLGIQINHYAAIDFSGFQNAVDTVGGLKIYLDAPPGTPRAASTCPPRAASPSTASRPRPTCGAGTTSPTRRGGGSPTRRRTSAASSASRTSSGA